MRLRIFAAAVVVLLAGWAHAQEAGKSEAGKYVPKTVEEKKAYMIGHGTNNNVHCMEATKEAEDQWVDTIKQLAIFSKSFLENCTPGYYNNEGKPGQGNSLIGSQYGGGPVAFFKILKDWREEGGLQGLTFS